MCPSSWYRVFPPYSATTQSSSLAIPAAICRIVTRLIGVTCGNSGSDGRPWAGADSVPTPKGKGCFAPPTRTFLIQGACSVLTRGAPQRLRPARKGGEQGERGKGSPLTSGSGGFSSGWSVGEKSVSAVTSEYCKEGINNVELSYSSCKPSNKTVSSLTVFLAFDRQFIVTKENLVTLRFTCQSTPYPSTINSKCIKIQQFVFLMDEITQ